jgi:hypothetical protein
MPLLCVGERRSPTAIARGWTWQDGRLAAKTLADALGALGLHYGQGYVCWNLFDDQGRWSQTHLDGIRDCAASGWQIVALGRVVARALRAAHIPHVALVHPAARGRIRQRARYQAHVASILQPLLRAGATRA